MSKSSLDGIAAAALEWPTIVQYLLPHVGSTLGQELLQAMQPTTEITAAQNHLQLTHELALLSQQGAKLRFQEISDYRPYLLRLRKGGTLIAEELYAIALTVECGSQLMATLRPLVADLAANGKSPLANLLKPYQTLSELGVLFKQIFNHRGEIRDAASSKLLEIRQRLSGLNGQIHQRLKDLLRERFTEEFFQEDYITLREDRLVLPLKANMKGKLKGIIHGSSGTGQTLFIEPDEVVLANNDLKEICQQEQEEIDRLLKQVSRVIQSFEAPLAQNLDLLAELDLTHAKALITLKISGQLPTLVKLPADYCFIGCRHPILTLLGKEVVANDVAISRDQHVLLISGPNAGGKTVMLKAMGLNSLLAAMGIPPAVLSPSRVPLPDRWLVEMSDGQSLEAGLSTFSAQLRNIAQLLKIATPQSWVLMDEIGTATDARQGEALTQALLESLAERGIKTVLSTHFAQLKRLPDVDRRFVNASMETDVKTHRPTYRLLMNVAGLSHALEMAKSAGLPEKLLGRARDLIHGSASHLEALEESLQEKRLELATWRADLQTRLSEAERLKAQLVKERDELKETSLQGLLPEVEELQRQFAQTRRRLREISGQLAPVKGAAIRKSLDTLATDLNQAKARATMPTDDRPLNVGDQVRWLESSQLATVTETARADGTLEIASGVMRIRVHRDEVKWVEKSSTLKSPRTHPSKPGPSQETLDLRGKSVEEALHQLEKHLDNAVLSGSVELLVIHGHGTDKLKTSVRRYLEKTPYPLTCRPGDPAEGGTGVTIIQID